MFEKTMEIYFAERIRDVSPTQEGLSLRFELHLRFYTHKLDNFVSLMLPRSGAKKCKL